MSIEIGSNAHRFATLTRLLSFGADAARDRVIVAMLEGIVSSEPRRGRRGPFVYLSPWWRLSSGIGDVTPMRVRLPNIVGVDAFSRGDVVRLVCQDVERPRRGLHAWTTIGAVIHDSPRSARHGHQEES